MQARRMPGLQEGKKTDGLKDKNTKNKRQKEKQNKDKRYGKLSSKIERCVQAIMLTCMNYFWDARFSRNFPQLKGVLTNPVFYSGFNKWFDSSYLRREMVKVYLILPLTANLR